MSTTAFTVNPDPKQIEKEHEERQKKSAIAAMYNRMFGGPSPLAPKPAIPAPEPPSTDPRREAFRKMGRILPPGMRL
jgi:hypothetical protein